MQTDKFILGAGKIYIEAESAGVLAGGELYVGDTPGFAIGVSGDIAETWSSDGAQSERQVAVPTRITRSASLQIKNMAMETMAWFFNGTHSAINQTNTPVADESITGVQQGSYYQLGRSTSNPNGVRNVSSVVVTGTGGTPTHVAGTDYSIDAVTGMLYIIPGGGIADDDDILVDYTPATESRNRVVTADSGAIYGALHFIADNTNGDNRDLYIPRMLLRANGELPFKSRDQFQMMDFSMEIQKRTGWPQIVIDDRAVA